VAVLAIDYVEAPKERLAAASSQRGMKLLSILLVALTLGGCSVLSPTGEEDVDDFRVPLVCSPEHTQLPCTGGVEEGIAYRFNLLTHCGVEWAYFDGRYWVPKPSVDAPSDWAGIEAGTIVLERRRVAVFGATKEGTVRFVPAAASYQPPDCE
jgi:hypothetical protein